MADSGHTSRSHRCPTLVAFLAGAWLALLAGAGLNAGWLFGALMKAGVQFRQGPATGIDSEETGRMLAGVLAQPAFVAVFLFGMLAGSLVAQAVVTKVMKLSYAGLDLHSAVLALGAALIAAMLGLLGTWRVLGEKPSRHLRAL